MDDLSGLDAVATLAAASERVRARREAEVDLLGLAGHWADLFGEPADARDPMTTPGGEGTPAVREYAIPELGIALGAHARTARALIADALDLRHRLPRTWAVIQDLGCEPWVARKVAAQTRHLPAAVTPIVDRAVARAITGRSPSTVLEIAAAKIIEADPQRHALAREESRRRRYVTLSRSDEHGYRHLIARVTAGDAVWLDAMVDRVADILTPTHGADHTHDELRSLALGWLARPAELLKLLLAHTIPDDEVREAAEASEKKPADEPALAPAWATGDLAVSLTRLADMTPAQLAALRGASATVFVHLDADSLLGQTGLARIEGTGPLMVHALADLLGHAQIRLQPVIDLHTTVQTHRYEHPDRLKDHIWLLAGGDAFPYAPGSATRAGVDFDHITPYQPPRHPDEPSDTGPPQTGTHNGQPLRRTHHRWKTHGGYRTRPAGGGRTLWQTPHGLCVLIDHTGTRVLPPHHAQMMLTAPPGLDVYPTDRYPAEVLFEPSAVT